MAAREGTYRWPCQGMAAVSAMAHNDALVFAWLELGAESSRHQYSIAGSCAPAGCTMSLRDSGAPPCWTRTVEGRVCYHVLLS